MKKHYFLIAVIAALCVLSNEEVFAQKDSCFLEISGGVGLETSSNFSFGAAFIGGFNVTNKMFLGAIVGYEYFDSLYMSTKYNVKEDYGYVYQPKNLLQFGLRVKRKFSTNLTSPFIGLDCGMNKQISNTEYACADGFFIKPTIGLDIDLGGGLIMYMAVAYKSQNNSYNVFDIPHGLSEERETRSELVNFSIGFQF